MKIIYLISSLKNCGPVNVLYSMIDNEKNDCTILTLKPEAEGSRIDDFKKRNIKVLCMGNGLKGIHRIVRYVGACEGVEIIHSHGIVPDLINNILKKNYAHSISSFVTTLHNNPIESYPLEYGRFKGKMIALAHIRIVKALKRIACSKTIQNFYSEKLRMKSYCVPNGVSYSEELLEKNKELYVYLGDLNERKNVGFILEAFKTPELRNKELWIIGDGPTYHKLEKNYNKYENIDFKGRTENPSEFYQKASFYVSASYSEGMPMACLEALSYGNKLILSNIPAHKEVGLNNSEVAEFFELNNLGNFIQIIQSSSINNSNPNYIKEFTKEFFDINNVKLNYRNLYKTF
ncbi:glycosyltransferase family 4 protein [Latilactobacillus curvatus]|uniref:glycosyltransferase family 4 protein n=1 Tax=Latilactobacillus curvatus TaxID=28038 RepID=UPI00345E1B1C